MEVWADSAGDRQRGLLQFLHKHLMLLGQARGWDTGPLKIAYDEVARASGRYEVVAPPKSSPDRRHKAQLRLNVDDRGDAWLTVAVLDRAGATITTSPPMLTYETLSNFNAIKRTLAWQGPDRLTVDPWPLGAPQRLGGVQTVTLPS